ncbi:MAG: ATP-binding protein [Candidatus Sericytochromatia bacterium]
MRFDKSSYLLQIPKYEKSSIILTSNKHFGDWGEIFGDNVIASAILDRLLHHSNVISIKGQSYRIKNRKNTFFSGGYNK